jgi:hypothetical protein
MRIRIVALASATMIAMGAGACSTGPDDEQTDAAIPAFDDATVPAAAGITVSHAIEAFPAATLRDWVSYADHVSLFTVLGERQQPQGEHELTYQEGLVGRLVTVRIDNVLWRSNAAPDVPREYSVVTDGWALNDGDLSPMGTEGGPRLEVGEQYLAPWIHDTGAGWGVLSVTAVFPVDDYGRAQRHEWAPPSLAGNALVGVLPYRVSWALSTTDPDPAVAEYTHLEPLLRRLAVDLAQLPDRAGFLPASREPTPGSQLGYVSEEAWQQLQRNQDTEAEVPFYDEAGNPYADDEGGGITLDGFALES